MSAREALEVLDSRDGGRGSVSKEPDRGGSHRKMWDPSHRTSPLSRPKVSWQLLRVALSSVASVIAAAVMSRCLLKLHRSSYSLARHPERGRPSQATRCLCCHRARPSRPACSYSFSDLVLLNPVLTRPSVSSCGDSFAGEMVAVLTRCLRELRRSRYSLVAVCRIMSVNTVTGSPSGGKAAGSFHLLRLRCGHGGEVGKGTVDEVC